VIVPKGLSLKNTSPEQAVTGLLAARLRAYGANGPTTAALRPRLSAPGAGLPTARAQAAQRGGPVMQPQQAGALPTNRGWDVPALSESGSTDAPQADTPGRPGDGYEAAEPDGAGVTEA